MNNAIAGFSKLTKEDKINWIANSYFSDASEAVSIIKKYSLLIGTRQKGRILSKYNYVSNTKKSIQKKLAYLQYKWKL